LLVLPQRLIEHQRRGRPPAPSRKIIRSTVKKDPHELITRFGLRNRTQAVAFAIRVGVL
jgi:hypothetical protein